MVKTYFKKKPLLKNRSRHAQVHETSPSCAIPANKYAVKWSSKIITIIKDENRSMYLKTVIYEVKYYLKVNKLRESGQERKTPG